MEYFLATLWFLFFSWIIYKWKFFSIDGISKIKIAGIFGLKVIGALTLVFIYTKFYRDRSTADIFKYFDDSKYIFDSFFVNPKHFFQLLTGFNADADYLKIYTSKTINWANQTDEYLRATHSMNFHFFESNRLMTRLNACLRFVSFGYYYVHCIIFIFIEMIGMFAILKSLRKFINSTNILTICIFFTPSVFIWSSGILKESVIFLGFGLLLLSVIQPQNLKYDILHLGGMVLSFFIILLTKYYIAVALIPALIAYFIGKKIPTKYLIWEYLALNTFLLIIVLQIHVVLPSINPLTIIEKKQNIAILTAKGGAYYTVVENQQKDTVYFEPSEMSKLDFTKDDYELPQGIQYHKIRNGIILDSLLQTQNDTTTFDRLFQYERAGSYIEIAKINSSVSGFLRAIPSSFFNAFLRPMIWESNNILVLFCSIEMIFVIFFFGCCLFFKKKKIESPNEFFFFINFALILYIIIGLTTPVLGTIVRLRIFALLSLIFAALMLINLERVQLLIGKTKKSYLEKNH